MAIELEFKFRATPETLGKIAADTPGETTRYAMETTYYDTPDGALSSRYITLRLRLENETSVCALKTPAKQGRNEFEVNAPSIETALPELCKLSGEELPQSVIPICGAKFIRLAKTLTLPGATVELALDEGILTGGGKEIPLCEVEVELKAGDSQVAMQYAANLAIAYGLETESRSKFRRSLALAKGECL